jgi:large subunit ribosomal protein L31
MKKDTHPEYRQVVFQDTSSDFKFLTRSTMSSAETSASHPFYTGKNMFIDTAGRVEKFRSRYANKTQSSAGKE